MTSNPSSGQRATRTDLHSALDALLDAADGGRLETDAFWAFAALLAQGRGITEGLHQDGLDAVKTTPDSPRTTLHQRQHRAYHIAVTAQILAGAGRMPDQGSFLPANYQHGVVVHDLLVLLGGKSGMGEAQPQVLTSGRGGQEGLRRAARRRLVGVVRWRMGATGKTRAQVWGNLMGDEDQSNGDQDADPTKLDRWQKEFGGPDGDLCRDAYAAGRAGLKMNEWNATNEDLAETIALARSGPGKRKLRADQSKTVKSR